MGFSPALSAVALAASSDRIVALSGGWDVGKSGDGIAWTQNTLTTFGSWSGLSYNGIVFCGVGPDGITATSPDGQTWTEHSVAALSGYPLSCVTALGSVFCGLAADTNKAFTSADSGITWTARTLPTTRSWKALAPSGSALVAIAGSSNKGARSTDGGANWSEITLPASRDWFAMAVSGSTVVAVAYGSDKGARSIDGGATWSEITLPATASWRSAAQNGNVFICLAEEGTGATSPDGQTWTQHDLPVGQAAGVVAALSTYFVFAGADGTTSLTSADDGVTWGTTPISLIPSGYAIAPIRMDVVIPSGYAIAPIRMDVYASGFAIAPIRMDVVDDLETFRFGGRVVVAGADLSGYVEGPIETDAEESGAATAKIELRPAAGSVDPLTWVGKTVTVDLLRIDAAGLSIPSRLFTGRVDMPTFDPISGLLRLECIDDLQNMVAALDRATLDDLTGGSYAEAAQGSVDDNWDYAQALMETVAGSLDAGRNGELRVTPWQGLPIWRTFTADDIYSVEPMELPRRRDLVNRVDIEFQYRYHRLRERRSSITWAGSILGTAALASGYQFPDLASVESAIAGLGWKVLSSAYNPAYAYVAASKPSGAPSGADSDWWIYDGGGIATYMARLGQRHAQTVTETYRLSVSAPDSIAANGTLAAPQRGALASPWNPAAWESDWSVDPDASAADMDYAPAGYARADADHVQETLLAMAQVRILASHRKARQTFSLPCLPELDTGKAIAIDHPNAACGGKVARVRHVIDTDAGTATTYCTIAISGIGAGGLLTPDDLTAAGPPDLDSTLEADPWTDAIPHLSTHVGAATLSPVYSDSLMGFLCNAPAQLRYYNFTLDVWFTAENPYYDAGAEFPTTGFRASMPGVADSHRNPVDLGQGATYQIAIPEDTFTLTAE